MKARFRLILALVVLPGCAQVRPGPHHAGLRALIYETTPTEAQARGKFEERPRGAKGPTYTSDQIARWWGRL